MIDKYAKLQWKLIALIVVIIIAALWALKHKDPVNLYLLPYGPPAAQVPLALVIMGSFFAGMLVSFAFSLRSQWTLHRRLKSLKRQLDESSEVIVEEKPYVPDSASIVSPPAEDNEGEALAPGVLSVKPESKSGGESPS